jgi:Swiss Army Knife protein, DSP-PTPase phosphatase domain
VSWDTEPGIVVLPDGARVRGRALRDGPAAGPAPHFGLYLRAWHPPAMPWPVVWVQWPDFWLPLDPQVARDAFTLAHRRALAGERVEVTCAGGRGRTGTALACIAQLAGVPAAQAVQWVREVYDAKAVETPWQRRYVQRFGRP